MPSDLEDFADALLIEGRSYGNFEIDQFLNRIAAQPSLEDIIDYSGSNVVLSSSDLGRIVCIRHTANSTVTVPFGMVSVSSKKKSLTLYNNGDFDVTIIFPDGAVATYPEGGLVIKPYTWVKLIEKSPNFWMVMTSGGGGGGTIPPGPPPVSSGLPTVTGLRRVNEVLTGVSGGWTIPPLSFGYQWLRDGADIVGATNQTYQLTENDAGFLISFRETAVNANGSTSVASSETIRVASLIKSFSTEVGTNPTVTKIKAMGLQNCVRVFVERTSSSMADIDIYIRENGGASTKILKAHPCVTYALAVDPGTELAFSTSNGRPLKAIAMVYNTSMPTSFPVSGTAATDRGGPTIWTPVAPHITLPTFNSAFEIVGNGTERHVFISEFDGVTWSPPKWLLIESAGSTYVQASSNQVAFLTSDGSNISIKGPTGTMIGGVSHRMHLPFLPITGTNRICSTVAEFKAAIAASVYGDGIGLNPLTYVMDIEIKRETFVSNHGVNGRQGAEGITIYSVNGNRDDVIITGNGTGKNGNWVLGRSFQPELAKPFMMRDVTLNFSGIDAGFMYEGGIVYLENINAYGPQTGATDIFSLGSPHIGNYLALCLDCDGHDALNDIWNIYAGSSSVGPAGSRVTLINCKGYTCGSLTNSQCLTTHTGFLAEMELGELSNSYRYVVQSGDATDPCHLRWVKTHKGARSASIIHLSMFGCNSSGMFSDIKITPGGYCLANKITPATSDTTAPEMPSPGFQSLGVFREAANTGVCIRGNYIDTSMAPAYFTSVPTLTVFDFNVIITPVKGILFDSDAVGVTGSAGIKRNTVIGASTAYHMNFDVAEMIMLGNVSKTSGVSIQVGSTTLPKITVKGSNVFDPTTSTYTAGPLDILGQDAQIGSNFRPIDGNCKSNTTTIALGINWFGGVDYRGIPLVFGPKTDRGALAFIENDPTQDLYADVWV